MNVVAMLNLPKVVTFGNGNTITYTYDGLFGKGLQTSNQPYKYNGKELDRFEGLDMYDYGARHYDAARGGWGTVDPLAEKKPWMSPYVYCSNNPTNRIDPDGRDDYYNEITGKYLGNDGTPGTAMRLIGQETYSDIKNNGEIGAWARIEGLQAAGRTITIDDAKIQADLQSIADLTSTPDAAGKYQEHQLFLTLDRNTATITSTIGPPGTEDKTTMQYYPAPSIGVNFLNNPINVPNGPVLIGQAHGHPPTSTPGMVTAKTMSPNYDVPTSASANIPVYGLDAMDGSTNGRPTSIHRVTPDGTITNNVGRTSSGFNIGRDAMQIWGRRP